MGLPSQSVLAWKITLTILQAVAISSTLYRIIRRYRIQRMWWDEYVLVVPLVMDTVYTVTFCLQFRASSPSPLDEILGSYWFQMFFFLTIVWSTRLVLALSLGRNFPPSHPARRYSISLVGLFLLLYIISVISPLFTCGGGKSSWNNECTNSKGNRLRGTVMAGADLLGDIILILFPLVFLWKITLPRRERALVLAVFSASILTLLSALVFAVMAFSGIDLGPQPNLVLSGLGHIEALTSLLVCNVAVVTTSLYRYYRNINNEASPHIIDSTEKITTSEAFGQVTPMSFTQVLDGTFENQSDGSSGLQDRSENRGQLSEAVRI